MRGKNQPSDLSTVFHKFQIFGTDQDGIYQASSNEELRVSKPKRNVKNNIIWNIGR